MSGPGWHLAAFMKWPVCPVVMVACDWLWQQLDLGAHEPQVLVAPEGIGVADGAPHPWVQDPFLSPDSALHLVFPRGSGQPQGKAVGGLACGSDCPLTPARSSSLKVAPCLTRARASPPDFVNAAVGVPCGVSQLREGSAACLPVERAGRKGREPRGHPGGSGGSLAGG